MQLRPGNDAQRLGLWEAIEKTGSFFHIKPVQLFNTFRDADSAEALVQKVTGSIARLQGKALDVHFARLSVDPP